ncbi:metal-dependent phosphohydrolase [Leptothoe sp. PORK10 BA2]|uniref:metal-dependent phosphohydrolase n=1 Tax=Leptothoe sp. PORK10 BA2 TaxID=3110254 RepID=UPI002B202866|nr:metal-dependent phosphohydrolase [Leptothoe sp. PORK10 BA2]MEA5466229.1 metal-dependent phosphohydrolase [Leptothoe sp. PORK10 BA2]
MKQSCVHQLHEKYIQMLGKPLGYLTSNPNPSFQPDYGVLLSAFAAQVLDKLIASTALYHNVEHTILVCLVGQEILHGKHHQEGNVTCEDWLNFMVSLLCHDIGYVAGVCRQDDVAQRRYVQGQFQPATGQLQEKAWVTLAPGATDASLSPYHVERSKLYVQENFSQYEVLDLAAIQQNIGFTLFPVPDEPVYQVTHHYPGLARAADLIGQLSDPCYLQKTVALFYEFEELGMNQELGYGSPDDLKLGFPEFYRTQVYPYIQPALAYLQATALGQQIVENLEANVRGVSHRDKLVLSKS